MELHALAAKGGYQKSQFEDIESIVQGIVGYKGDVHVAFGRPMDAAFETAEELAQEIDRTIVSNYHLHSSNLLAAEQAVDQIAADKRARYQSRIAGIDSDSLPWFIAQYANPVLNKQKLAALTTTEGTHEQQ